MIRIRTTLPSGHIFTIFHEGQWITVLSYNDRYRKGTSMVAPNLLGAGENHLRCAEIMVNQEELEKYDGRTK